MEEDKGGERALHDEFAHVRFPDLGPVHKGVFAVAEEGHEDVEFVLVAGQEVGAEEEGDDQLIWKGGEWSVFFTLYCGRRCRGGRDGGKRRGEGTSIQRKRTYQGPDSSRTIFQDHVVATPEAGEEAGQTEDQSDQHAQWDKVAESFGLQEAGEGVAFHGLEDVFFGIVEDLWVIASGLLDGVDDLVEDLLGKHDFAFRAGEDEGVEDLFGAGADVGSGDGVAW